MERDAFLTTVGRHLAGPEHPSRTHPLQHVDPLPSVVHARELEDPAGAFEDAADRLGVDFRRLENAGHLVDLLAEIASTHQVKSALLTSDPELEGVWSNLKVLGIDARRSATPQEDATVDLGIAVASFGIAATGSLVLDASRSKSRTPSLLPPVFLCLLPIQRLLPTAGDMLRAMGDRFPGGLPSQLVFVTGPSRSADIELTLTVGVHGPGTVYVGLI